MTHARSRLIVAAAGALVLAGCAVPGQDAAAGTAAEYHGTTVTNEQVDATFAAWAEDSEGRLVSTRDEALTMELLHDDLLAASAELGYAIYTSDARNLATQWFVGLGITETPSDALVHSFESQFALTVLAYNDGTEQLTAIIESAEADAAVSPRAGQIDPEAFLAAVANAKAEADQTQLGQMSFIPFQHVSAFSDAGASWQARG